MNSLHYNEMMDLSIWIDFFTINKLGKIQHIQEVCLVINKFCYFT